MPDILIYRMKMPENEPLRLVLNSNGQLFVDHGVTFTEYEAVELPPHGDLIDRDKYAAEMKKRQNACRDWIEELNEHDDLELYHRANGTYSAFIETKLTLDKMPVIIPASEGSEN